MSNIINVRLTGNDKFVVTNPDTGEEKMFDSIVLHDPLRFIVESCVKDLFCEAFPGKTQWVCTAEALERINNICEFNCITDECQWNGK